MGGLLSLDQYNYCPLWSHGPGKWIGCSCHWTIFFKTGITWLIIYLHVWASRGISLLWHHPRFNINSKPHTKNALTSGQEFLTKKKSRQWEGGCKSGHALCTTAPRICEGYNKLHRKLLFILHGFDFFCIPLRKRLLPSQGPGIYQSGFWDWGQQEGTPKTGSPHGETKRKELQP
jgi:hypothetical protein